MDEFDDSQLVSTPGLIYENGGTWNISRSTAAAVATNILNSTSNRPEKVFISGAEWDEISLLGFLGRISSVNCKVHLIPSDSFFISKEATKKRVAALMSGRNRFVYLVNTDSLFKLNRTDIFTKYNEFLIK